MTAKSPNSPFRFFGFGLGMDFGLGLGLGLVNIENKDIMIR